MKTNKSRLKECYFEKNRIITVNNSNNEWVEMEFLVFKPIVESTCYPYCFFDIALPVNFCMYHHNLKLAKSFLEKKEFKCTGCSSLSHIEMHDLHMETEDGMMALVRGLVEKLSYDEISELVSETTFQNYNDLQKKAVECLIYYNLAQFSKFVHDGKPEGSLLYIENRFQLDAKKFLDGYFSLKEKGKMFISAWSHHAIFQDRLDEIQEELDEIPSEVFEKCIKRSELKTLRKLRERNEITIYRGVRSDKNSCPTEGFSWTLDLNIARFFAYKYNQTCYKVYDYGYVLKAVVDPKDIYFYLNNRKEKEVVISPASVHNIEVIEKQKIS